MSENKLRDDFPIFKNNPGLVYLDQGATGQYPQVVLDTLQTYLTHGNAAVHRGLFKLAQQATDQFEGVRTQVAGFLGNGDAAEIIFTSGTTAGLNMVAAAFGSEVVQAGDEIITSVAEHHSNFLPWQRLAQQRGAKLLVAPLTTDGHIDTDWVVNHVSARTRIVALAHVTNVVGAVMSTAAIKAIAAAVHAVSGYLVLDGAQAAGHMQVNVRDLDADFYAFSGHKVYGPAGTGVLYGKMSVLKMMEPQLLGGGMIETVTVESATWAEIPMRFEAGSQNVPGVIGLGAALNYLTTNAAVIWTHEAELVTRLRTGLAAVSGVTVYGAAGAAGAVSFNLDGVHPHDLATFLDEDDIAVRAGHHCAQPLMQVMCVPATVRASIGAYSTEEDCDRLIEGVAAAGRFFNGNESD